MTRLMLAGLAIAFIFLALVAHAEPPLAGWKVINGQWTAKGKGVVGHNGYLVNEQGTWRNFRLTAQIRIIEWGEGAAGLRLRSSAPGKKDDCYRLLLRQDQRVTFDKILKGDWIQLHSMNTALPTGKWFKIGFAAKGGRVQVSFDGKTVFTHTDAQPITQGAVVLWVQQSRVEFRDIKIKAME